MATRVKDPEAITKYGFDWNPYLNNLRTIVSSTWSINSPVVIVSSNISDGTTNVIISGGVSGNTYKLINEIELDDGQVEYRSITIIVRER